MQEIISSKYTTIGDEGKSQRCLRFPIAWYHRLMILMQDDLVEYTERLGYYFVANGVDDAEKQHSNYYPSH